MILTSRWLGQQFLCAYWCLRTCVLKHAGYNFWTRVCIPFWYILDGTFWHTLNLAFLQWEWIWTLMIARSSGHQNRQPLLLSFRMLLNMKLQLVSPMQARMTSSLHVRVIHKRSGLILMLFLSMAVAFPWPTVFVGTPILQIVLMQIPLGKKRMGCAFWIFRIYWKCLQVGGSSFVDGQCGMFFTTVSACGITPVVMRKYNKLRWPHCILEKVVANTTPAVCLVNPFNVVEIKQ